MRERDGGNMPEKWGGGKIGGGGKENRLAEQLPAKRTKKERGRNK
jgi:hypothetical protein